MKQKHIELKMQVGTEIYKVGEQISFGYTAKFEDEKSRPENFNMLGIQESVHDDQYQIDYVITSSWEKGYIMEMVITNLSDIVISDWQVQFDFNLKMKNIWNGVISEDPSGTYKIHNAGNNADIKVKDTAIVGFEIETTNGIIEYPENEVLEQVNYEEESESDDDYLDALYEYYGIDKKIEDNDNDGLPDEIEMLYLGLDPTLMDSDEDGVLDANEDYDEDGLDNQTELSLKSDFTDSDCDADELLDGEEYYEYKTDIFNEDTDNDGLSDYEEIHLKTNPLEPKTDGVNLDSERNFEQKLSTENISIQNDEREILPPTLVCNVKGYADSYISIKEAELDSYLSNRALIGMPIEIRDEKDEEFNGELSFDLSKLIDTDAYNLESIKDLTICKLDGYEEKLSQQEGDAEETSALEENYIVDEDGGLLCAESEAEIVKDVEVPTYSYLPLDTEFTKENNMLSAKIDNDGIYMVVNGSQFLSSMGISLKDVKSIEPQMVKGQADIVFVVDSTGSMGSAINNTARNVTDFVEELENTYNVQTNFSLIEYKDIKEDGSNSTKVHQNGFSNWYSDADEFSKEIRSLLVNGGGDIPESLVDALGMAETLDYREDVDKFVIIITDADYKTENNYGYNSLEEVVQRLNDNAVTTSIITRKKYENIYKCITKDCNGVFGDIDKKFVTELEKLISLIGESSEEGVWYLLDNYEYVKLNKEYSKLGNQDSDGDGLTDVEELGKVGKIDFAPLVTNLIQRYGSSLKATEKENLLNQISLKEFGRNVYQARSNPRMLDTDMDGIKDAYDRYPRNSMQSAEFGHDKVNFPTGATDLVKRENVSTKYNVTYNLNFKDFFASNKRFNSRLCKASCLMAGLAYDKGSADPKAAADDYYYMRYNKLGTKKKITSVLKMHGFSNIVTYNIGTDNHQTKCYIGVNTVEYRKKKKQIIAVVIKGTNGTAAQWSSNFNIGLGKSNAIDAHDGWKNVSNHKGFDIAANRVYNCIQNYQNKYVNQSIPKAYWVTGHSRGAAVANIAAARLVDNGKIVFAYTFATPNTTTSANKSNSKYDCIFNTLNARDFVPTVPCAGWGFGQYGKTASITMSTTMKKTWKKRLLTYKGNEKGKKNSYNEMSAKHLNSLVSALKGITPNRSSIYKYADTNQKIQLKRSKVYQGNKIKTTYMTAVSKKELDAVKGYKMRMIDDNKKVEVSQSPMYFMQYVASTMPASNINEKNANKIPTMDFALQNIPPKYEKAKSQLIRTNVFRGVSHAHFVDAYVIISEKVNERNYR